MNAVRKMGAQAFIVALLGSLCLAVPQPSPAAPKAKATWGIVTGTLYLDKKETAKLAVGAGAATTLGAFLPPPFDVVVVAIAGTVTLWAGWAVADGKCIKIKSYGAVGVYGPKDRKGRWCR